MKNNLLKVSFTSLCFLMANGIFSSAATAADTPFYLGAGLGISNASKSCSQLGGDGFSGSCDKKDSGIKIVGGYKFSEYLSAEIAYVNLGEFKASGTATSGAIDAKAKVSGFQFGVLGQWSFADSFSVLGKLGGFRWDQKISGTASPTLSTGGTKGTDIFWGMGLQYDFSRNFGIRAEWERYLDIGKSNKSDVDLFSINGLWQF